MTLQQNYQMIFVPDCHPCILDQVKATIKLAKLTTQQSARVLKATQAILEESEKKPLLAQHIIRRITDTILEEMGKGPEFDLYAEIKQKSNQVALQYAEQFKQTIQASQTPLETSLHIAAAGNIIDFGAKNSRGLNVEAELQALHKPSFDWYDIKELHEKLRRASTLLYVCDNCGEIIFDMLFIREIRRKYPQIEVTAAFRDRPIINDATLQDAHETGFSQVAACISSGSVYPGTILPESSRIFRQHFAAADVIISKGQGNYETLLPEANERLFFLLRIKCKHMASLSGVQEGSLVLLNGSKVSKKFHAN
ncbi:MAG: DUF89 family protein [Anaerolineales bacterium]|nr:DUF89 family protein [Anaerolineales bacterium]